LYDQLALFLVKRINKPRFGLLLSDLTTEQRAEIERNTGAKIDVVVESTSAFLANVLVGDYLIAIDDIEIIDSEHAEQVIASVKPEQKDSTLTVIRKGVKKKIKVTFLE
jgi:S1-C subfamily serine protease